jgi:putative transposase
MIDWDDRTMSIKSQAELLSLNRSGLYYRPLAPSVEEVALKHSIDELYTRHPCYGSRRITATLRREGWRLNRKAVQRHMREMGIVGISPGPNLSKRRSDHKVYPYLLRGLSITEPNQVWGIDITYIRLAKGWLYLVAIIDWFSRYVVSWELDDSLEVGFVLSAVSKAFAQATPDILNSDQGSQFTCPAYLDLLHGAGVRVSMNGKGRASDNIFTERLWRSLKYEEVYLHDYQSPREARTGIGTYFDFYPVVSGANGNHERLHQSLDYQAPAEVYFGSNPQPNDTATHTHQALMEGRECSLDHPQIVS